MGPTEENKAIVKRLYGELNRGNLNVADELIVPDYAQHSILPVPPGREGFKQFFAAFGAAFPDAHFAIEDLFGEGDRVAMRFRGQFTHKGPFMGIPPSGKRITMTGIDVFRLKGGKIVEHWDQVDQLGFLQQLGAIPPTGEPRKQ